MSLLATAGIFNTLPSGGGGTTTDFVMNVTTTGSDETFMIQVYNSGASWNTTGVYVDWDGGTTITNPTTYGHAGLSHVYPSAGSHEIRIYRNGTGTLPNFYFANSSTMAQKITSVTNLGDLGCVSFSGGFQGCSNMTSFVAGNCDTSNVTYLSNMFHTCTSMTTCDLTGFTTPAVTYMDGMFESASALTSVDVTGFDTADVITFTRMFRYCSSLSGVDPSGWDIGSVTGLGFSNFIEDWALSTAVYDALLIAWEAQTPPSGVAANFGSGTTYTSGGAAATARSSLTGTYSWTISDGGTA